MATWALKAGHMVWIFSIYNIFLGFFIPGFDPIGQSISEMALESKFFALTHRGANIVIGLSMCTFALCLQSMYKKGLSFTMLAIVLLGLSMISAGIWTLETPLHLLYNLSIFMILVPVVFVAEFNNDVKSKSFQTVGILCGFIHVGMFWAIYAGFIPHELNGFIQRAWAVVTMGWFGLAAYHMSKETLRKQNQRDSPA